MSEGIPDEYLGPAMQALSSEMQKLFCFYYGGAGLTGAEAARQAGYSDSNDGAKKAAYKLLQQENISLAVAEVSRRSLIGLVPIAVQTMREIMEDKNHPQRARVAETILDRTGYSPKTEHKLTVEHTANVEQLEAWARQYALERGLAADALLPNSRITDSRVMDVEPAETGKPPEV